MDRTSPTERRWGSALVLVIAFVALLLAIVAVVAAFAAFRDSNGKDNHNAAPTPRFGLAPALLVDARLAGTWQSAAVQCQAQGSGCAAALLALMNTQRQNVGSPPLQIDWTLVHHHATGPACVSAQDHAHHLAERVKTWADFGAYAHDQFSEACSIVLLHAGAQNVGFASGNKYVAAIADFDDMMGEHHPGLGTCMWGHDCNITFHGFTHVGIAFAYDTQMPYGGAWMVVEDFAP